MQLEITNIPDLAVATQNGAAEKLFLMEEIIKLFTPLFSVEIDKKQQQLESNKQDYLELLERVSKIKNQLEHLNQQIFREKIVASILKDVKILIDKDVLYGNTKKVVSDVFKVLDTASGKDLKLHSEQIKNIVQKTSVKNK